MAVHVGRDGGAAGSQPFPTGLPDGQESPGRPVDMQPLRDGRLLVSDDDNGAVHRITHNAKERWDALPGRAF